MNIKRNSQEPFKEADITVSFEALNFLKSTTGGVSHFAIYFDLITNMATTLVTFDKRGIAVPLGPGQVEASANAMAARWGLSRKVLTRLLSTMQQLGLIELYTSKLTSVATLTAIKAWKTRNGDHCINESIGRHPDQQNIEPSSPDENTVPDCREETEQVPAYDKQTSNKEKETDEELPVMPSKSISDSQRTSAHTGEELPDIGG